MTGITTGSCNLAELAAQAGARGGTLHFEGERFDGGELFERSTRLAAGLVDRGVAPGDRVVVLMANCPEVGIAYQAIWRAGAVTTPVIFLVTAAELAHILTDSGAVAVITTPEFAPKVVETGVQVTTYVVGTESYAELEAHPTIAIVPRADDDLAALLYTGGTTGRSKGVMLTHRNVWNAGKVGSDDTYVEGVTVSMTALPLSHTYGLLVTASGLHNPEPLTTVLQRWFNPATFLDLAVEHRVQRIQVVPSMLQMLLGFPLESYDLSALRFIGSGGSPLAPAVIQEWERQVPSSQIQEGYGLTETTALASLSSRARRIGSVGKPCTGVDLRIVDASGKPVPAGIDGEICIRSITVTPGYWNAPEATAASIVDGWLHTGDIGHLDADGFLFVVDRIKDLIIRSGFNVYPRDIEDVLVAHPAVASAAVVGRPDPVHGEEVVALVALRDGASATSAELQAFAKEHISAAKYPREVRIIDGIPLTSVGKTDRKRVRTMLAAEAADASRQ